MDKSAQGWVAHGGPIRRPIPHGSPIGSGVGRSRSVTMRNGSVEWDGSVRMRDGLVEYPLLARLKGWVFFL